MMTIVIATIINITAITTVTALCVKAAGVAAAPDKYFATASFLTPTGSLATLPMAREFLASFVL
jgi:hypothetical protein